MSGLGCDRTHGRSGSAQIETNKFQSTLPEGSDRRHQQICGASLRRRVERPHHDTSQVVHLLKIPDFLFVSILISAGDFEQRENGGVFLNDAGRKTVLAAWQKRKQEVITHPFLGEKMPWGLIPYVQALLLARAIRGDIDAYPPFMWK